MTTSYSSRNVLIFSISLMCVTSMSCSVFDMTAITLSEISVRKFHLDSSDCANVKAHIYDNAPIIGWSIMPYKNNVIWLMHNNIDISLCPVWRGKPLCVNQIYYYTNSSITKHCCSVASPEVVILQPVTTSYNSVQLVRFLVRFSERTSWLIKFTGWDLKIPAI